MSRKFPKQTDTEIHRNLPRLISNDEARNASRLLIQEIEQTSKNILSASFQDLSEVRSELSNPPLLEKSKRLTDTEAKEMYRSFSEKVSGLPGSNDQVLRSVEASVRNLISPRRKTKKEPARKLVEIEKVSIGIDRLGKGIDKFYVDIDFVILNNVKIKEFSVYRSEMKDVNSEKIHKFSLLGLNRLTTDSEKLLLRAPEVTGVKNSSLTNNQSLVTKSDLRRVEQLRSVNVENVPTTTPESEKFRKIGTVKFDKNESRSNFVFRDSSVLFGSGYRYYVLPVLDSDIEGARSKISSVVVSCVRVPPRPHVEFFSKDSKVSLDVSYDDDLIEKFEIYRKNKNIFVGDDIDSIISVSSNDGEIVELRNVKKIGNGFVQVGECIPSAHFSSFVDTRVIPGNEYIYRVFSVDVFGNKSESPFEFSVFVPARSERVSKPRISIVGEYLESEKKVKVSIDCNDNSIKTFLVERRDFTSGHNIFSPVFQGVSRKIGYQRNQFSSLSFNGALNDIERIPRTIESIDGRGTFFDNTVRVDRIYQYRVRGIDSKGNSTDFSLSDMFMTLRRPNVEPPVSLSCENIFNESGSFVGVNLSWENGNEDVSSDDKLGSQNKLSDTSVRTLFHLERRDTDEGRWYPFPLISGTEITDFADEKREQYPPNILENHNYEYRMRLVQSGTFLSRYTEPVEIFTARDTLAPENVSLNSSPTDVRPLFIAVNWDTQDLSGEVDRWEIERAVVNNLSVYSNNLVVSDSENIPFEKFRTVYRESSRSLSKENDSVGRREAQFKGEHFFPDLNVSLGNSYIYRIRAIGLNGKQSDWVYKGIKMIDGSSDRTMKKMLSDSQRETLSRSRRKIILSEDNGRKDSFSIEPEFSRSK